mgnify:FL=1
MTQKERDLDMMHRGQQEEKIQMVEKLLNKSMDISFISEVTGLSNEEIEDLQKSMLVT